MTNKTIEQKADQYLKTGGVHCPHCLYFDIEAQSPKSHDAGWSQRCLCLRCGSEWTDEHGLCAVTIDDVTYEQQGVTLSDDVRRLLDMVEAIESAHVVYAGPAQEEAIRQGIEAARRLREEVSEHG